jgi:hypothetical protein
MLSMRIFISCVVFAMEILSLHEGISASIFGSETTLPTCTWKSASWFERNRHSYDVCTCWPWKTERAGWGGCVCVGYRTPGMTNWRPAMSFYVARSKVSPMWKICLLERLLSKWDKLSDSRFKSKISASDPRARKVSNWKCVVFKATPFFSSQGMKKELSFGKWF